MDAFGSDTKSYITTGERRETFRCPTAEDVYHQCKLMPQPRIATDMNRELEMCDERVQVYLVDIKDATPSHIADPNVIVTNSIEETWDASEIRGIKSIYSLRGYKGGCHDDKCVVQMRNHPCNCIECRQRNYQACEYVDTVGTWVPTTMTRKSIPKVYDEVTENLLPVTKFFHGAILQSNPIIILGIMMKQKSDGTRHLKYATFAAPPRINKKEAQTQEYKIDNINYIVAVERKMAYVRVKILANHPTKTDEFLLPINAKQIDFPVSDLIDPSILQQNNPHLDRLNYVDYQTLQSSFVNNRNKLCLQTTYKISDANLKWFESRCVVHISSST